MQKRNPLFTLALGGAMLALAACSPLGDAAEAGATPSSGDAPAVADAQSTDDGADAPVRARLDAMGTPYTVDEDGDFQITVDVGNGRTQLVWVRSVVETTDHHQVREIWSPGYRSETGSFSAAIANDLLERSHLLKLGSWVKQDDVAMLVVKIPADADADALDEAIDLAAAAADALERELMGSDDL